MTFTIADERPLLANHATATTEMVNVFLALASAMFAGTLDRAGQTARILGHATIATANAVTAFASDGTSKASRILVLATGAVAVFVAGRTATAACGGALRSVIVVACFAMEVRIRRVHFAVGRCKHRCHDTAGG